jgi:hypothetical protein
MLVKDIKPGMKGYGKTVFKGTKIETFKVEILGVMKKANMGTDLILVKLAGGPITQRGANLIEGMSGSPIYVNGKIIGAFAYGGIFSKEPIGMVTPIEYMLEAWDSSLPAKPSSFYPFSTIDLSKPIAISGRTFTKLIIDDGSGFTNYDSSTLVMRPLATPLIASGMSPKTLARLEDALKPFNVRLIAGPGKPAAPLNLNANLEPGAAIGVSFITGDVELTGVGTLTYRRGNRIVAFGHPMFGLGTIDAALTTAYVHDILPSYMVSSKIASPLSTIGRIRQDRPWSVAGEIGKFPEMIPVTVHIRSQSPKRKRIFRVNVMNHPLIATLFTPLAVSEGILEVVGSPTDVTAKVRTTVVAEELGTITRENVFFDSTSIEFTATTELRQIIQMLQFNQFYPVSLKKVEMEVELIPSHQTARLDRIFVRQGKYKPGETIEIGAVLRPFKGERITKTIKIKLPSNLQNGPATIQVSGGSTTTPSILEPSIEDTEPESSIIMSFTTQPSNSAMSSVENIQQLVKKFLERDKNNELVAKIILPKPIPSISGEKFSNLPPSINSVMKTTKATALATERNEIKVVTPTEWIISGSQRLTITIQSEDKREKKPTPPTTPSPPSEEETEESPEESPSQEEAGTSEDQATTLGQLINYSYNTLASTLPTTSEPLKNEKNSQTAPPHYDKSKNSNSTPSSLPSTSGTGEKPVGRMPNIWKQTTRSDFMTGKMTNVAATTSDLLIIAGSLRQLCNLDDTIAWCAVPDDKGNLYVGTGHRGIIYKVTSDGNTSIFYDSPELEINSLVIDESGNLYAGTSPNGIIYKITPEGTASCLYDAEEKYILNLVMDSKGCLYAATGDKCKVYKIASDGKVNVVLNTPEAHTICLAVDKEDNLYVGTALNGIIYKVTPEGVVSVYYDAPEESITALAVDLKGTLYAGTSPKGVIYKIAPGITPKVVYDKAGQGITAIAIDNMDNIYAANSTYVFKILPDDTICTLANDRDVQFISVALSGNQLFATTGNMAEVYVAQISGILKATYESSSHDCGTVSKWGIIEWTADIPSGAEVQVQTRTGNVAQPDSTWSSWSPVYSRPGEKIVSPPGRYIQYLLTIKPGTDGATPKIKDVSIVYLPQNQPPRVNFTSPQGGEKWAGKKTIKWSGSDPDKDTLIYELFYSADGGATWQPINEKIKSTPPQPGEELGVEEPSEDNDSFEKEPSTEPEELESTNSFNAEEAITDLVEELEKHPEIPQEVKDQIIANATNMATTSIQIAEHSSKEKLNTSNQQQGKSSNNATKQTSYTWDTSQVKDGIYILKIIASDRISNPTEALTAEAVSEPVVVCNKPPKITAFKKAITIQADNSARIEGVAYQELVGIAGVQYRVDPSEDWIAAAATDGIFDSTFEPFTITTEPLQKGIHYIEIKAIDQAGNASTTKVDVIVN